MVDGAERRVPEAGSEMVLLGAECRHLAREVVDPAEVWWWVDQR
jgi:hypothetical protein